MSNPFTTKPLSDRDLEELKKQKQSLTTVCRVVSVVLVALIAVFLMDLYQARGFSTSSGSLAGFGGLSLATTAKLEKVKAEIN